jgi:ankyrin repeat protein
MAIALAKEGAGIEIADSLGRTPLMEAARDGQTELITALLDAGANPLAKDNAGKTALDLAVKWNETEAAEILRQELNKAGVRIKK